MRETCKNRSQRDAYKGRIGVSALKVLYRWADDHLIDFHLDRLLNCVSDRSGDRACRDGHFHELAQILSVASSELLSDSSVAIAPGEIIVQRIFWECSSIRNPSVNARTAALVAQ